MGRIVLQNVTKQFGHTVVLTGVSVEFETGQITGLVGANGCGKTTLLRMVAGELDPDTGTVSRTRGLESGYLPQELALNGSRTLYDEVAEAFAERSRIEQQIHALTQKMEKCHDDSKLPSLLDEYDKLRTRFDRAGGYGAEARTREMLAGVGFTKSDLDLPVSALSGGQKCRAALARLLLQDREMLLLDEPTNHLDMEATDWLEKILAAHRGGTVIVSHDRYLLDRLATRIVELENGGAQSYTGNYSAYVEARSLKRLTQQRQFEKDRAVIQKERAFISKHLAGQRTKEAKGRRKRLDRRLKAGEFVEAAPSAERGIRLGFRTVEATSKVVLTLSQISKRYGDKTLFEHLDLEVYRGERLGIIGPNGSGKSTLLRMAMGLVEPDHGDIRLTPTLSVGYHDQEHADLDPSGTVLDTVRSAAPQQSERQIRSYLGQFLFTGDDVFKPMSALSGGEQSRVRLAALILSQPQVVLLDEPTNHLDIRSREVLEDALADYEGTLIMASHDRYLLDRVVTRLLIIEAGSYQLFRGTYSEYVAHRDAKRIDSSPPSPPPTEASPKLTKRSGRSKAKEPRSQRQPSPYDHMSIDDLETLIETREDELKVLNEEYGQDATVRDPAALKALNERVEMAHDELASLEAAWEERSEHV